MYYILFETLIVIFDKSMRTLTYIENLKKAGIKAKVDIYPKCFHAFDMQLPFMKVSKQAAKAFEEQYLYAAEHYFAPQKKENM